LLFYFAISVWLQATGRYYEKWRQLDEIISVFHSPATGRHPI
jgi:hypothetical protein